MPPLTPEEEEQARLEAEEAQRLEQERDINGNNDSIPAWQLEVFSAQSNARRERERAEAAERELAELRKPKLVEEPLEEGEPFANPAKFLNRIQSAMDRSVAPVNKFMAEQTRISDYNKLKNSMKQGADATALANFAKLEPLIDEAYANDSNLPITLQEFTKQITIAVGTLTLRGAYNTPIPPVIPPKNNREVIPPINRPTPSVIRNRPADAEPDLNEFTENERRLMREQGMTPGEYKTMRDTPDHEQAEAWRSILAKRKARAAGGR